MTARLILWLLAAGLLYGSARIAPLVDDARWSLLVAFLSGGLAATATMGRRGT